MADANAAVIDPNATLKKLSESISSYKAPEKWAYDPQYEAATNTINRNIAGLTSQNDLTTQRTDEDWKSNVGEAGRINTQNQSSLQNKLANQGIGFSGVNVSEQGRLGEAYQKSLGDLNKGKTRTLENLAFDTANQTAQWQNQLGEAQAARAGREAERERIRAEAEAQAAAAKAQADAQRQWMQDLQSRITQLAQPAPTPTGQMNPAPKPQAVIQKAIQAVPPPPKPAVDKETIKETQYYLNKWGFNLTEDGLLGPRTTKALLEWKQKNGLPANTDIDEATAALLMKGPTQVAGRSTSLRSNPGMAM